jgi:hypothetical protein
VSNSLCPKRNALSAEGVRFKYLVYDSTNLVRRHRGLRTGRTGPVAAKLLTSTGAGIVVRVGRFKTRSEASRSRNVYCLPTCKLILRPRQKRHWLSASGSLCSGIIDPEINRFWSRWFGQAYLGTLEEFDPWSLTQQPIICSSSGHPKGPLRLRRPCSESLCELPP